MHAVLRSLLLLVSALGPLAATAAHAQTVSAVPPGATAVTVMVCDRPDGCPEELAAMTDHCAAQGIPLLDFEAVADGVLGGGNARQALDQAQAQAAAKPDLTRLEAVRGAMRITPLTLPPDEPFLLWLRTGAARLAQGDEMGATWAFNAAASTSGGRVHDLPPLSQDALEQYLAAAEGLDQTATLRITADQPDSNVFIDGLLVGPAPIQAVIEAGWHRVSVERRGRRTAWVGEVEALPGRTLSVDATLAEDDAPAALEAAVIGSMRGAPPPPDVSRRLADWARDQGLSTVRFVQVSPPAAAGKVPEERVQTPGGMYDVHASWLDVSSQRFSRSGAGPATLRSKADPERFSLGVQLGYMRLQHTLQTGLEPHDHVDLEIVGLVMLRRSLFLDARLGLWRAAQPYYLYDDWLSQELFPVAVGLRLAPGRSGLHVGAHALALVPLAAGGQGFAGWTWKPTARWRIGIEARGGMTDQGPIFGGGLSAAFAG